MQSNSEGGLVDALHEARTGADGVVHFDGKGSHLVTQRDYRDFELWLDWKITPGGDSGDYAHGSRSGVISRSRTWDAGYVTLMHDTWGWLYRDVLGQMIDEMRERGLGFSTICVLEEITEPVTTW